MSSEKKYILSKEIAHKKLRRIAMEIVERNYDEPEIVLIGIKENGIVIAHIIADFLSSIFKGNIIVAALKINKKQPAEISIEPIIDFNNKVLILVDDVANSGRTMLYALKPMLQTYPKKIQTAALVERTHKSFPIALDYVGMSISTNLNEHITVEVTQTEVLGAWMELG